MFIRISNMGVPAFFVYLVKKYPDIMIDLEPRSPSETEEEYFYRVGEEYATAIACDNLYLDCNGIIHPCCHPEGGQPQPKTEDEMFANVAALIDSIVELVRPKRVLYLAIDGVAPRAKMNQQRSRRFRSAKETAEKTAASAVVRAQFAREGLAEPPTPPPSWDRNVITPGTPFMERLARFLRHYVATRIESHPLWRGLGVVLSDAGVPGEGEHKLIEFIRTQRTQPGYDPLTRHVLMGEDADLIMLALATHEINFSILRERRFMKRNQCFKCGSFGHSSYQCKAPPPAEKPFSLLSVAVLRQWLQQDFEGMMIEGVDGSSEAFARADFERYVDDFVFLCFFVGNDFLPHAPALDIRDGSLELLMRLYKEIAPEHGYITNSGAVLWDGLRPLLRRIAEVEPQMLKKKLAKAKRNAKYNRNRGGGRGGNRKYSKTRGGKQRCHAFDRGGCAYGDRCKFAHGDAGGAPPRERCFFFDRDGTCRNGDSCRFAHGPDAEVAAPPPPTPEEEAAASTAAFKNRLKDLLEESEAQEIKLALDRERQGMSSGMGEGGYAERFYSVKFRGGAPAPTPTPESSASGAAGDDLVANPRGVPAGLIESYLEGLCWVLSVRTVRFLCTHRAQSVSAAINHGSSHSKLKTQTDFPLSSPSSFAVLLQRRPHRPLVRLQLGLPVPLRTVRRRHRCVLRLAWFSTAERVRARGGRACRARHHARRGCRRGGRSRRISGRISHARDAVPPAHAANGRAARRQRALPPYCLPGADGKPRLPAPLRAGGHVPRTSRSRP